MNLKSKFIEIKDLYSKEKKQEEDHESNINLDKDFSNACLKMKESRLKSGITINQLSSKTKVSISVLEAIENGWQHLLPERTFLRQMLTSIEAELGLSEKSLIDILNKSKAPTKKKPLRTFTPAKIDFFRSWEGNLIYIILIMISIFVLNRQQIYLSNINAITTSPLKINSFKNLKKDINSSDKSKDKTTPIIKDLISE